MGLIFPANYAFKSNYINKKMIKTKQESNVSREQAVKQLTLRNKIFLRTEIPIFKSKDE